MLAAIFVIALIGGSHGFESDADVEDANAYVDSVLEFELPRRMATLDPVKARDFQPMNGKHLYGPSVRFVFFSVTGFRDIRRDGDCQLTRADEEHPTVLQCKLSTKLRYDVVVNMTYENTTMHDVRINGTFHGVSGPLTVTFRRSLPVKVEFSPRYDVMLDSVGMRRARPHWYTGIMEREFHLAMIHVFEFATRRVFAKEMFNAAKDVPFPE
ncbi:uncharacterized protein LOC119455533 [Dermacentor silvarum]|uniref:uncharacterized protein LOC119455533 n=1 Tax=Dermacentor silvarum TaxID=543639 RepID=UPI001899E7A3|nr:uncharacterized protein LOC119455533 [Dermacentor silvarum]